MSGSTIRSFRLALPFSLVSMLALACGDVQAPELPRAPGPPAPLSTVIVSDPGNSFTGSKASVAPGSPVAAGLVYASLAPGTVPDGDRIVIRTRVTGVEVGTELIDGGFDPIAIPATVGDTLDIRLYLADRTEPEETIAVVPERRPPVLVRVDPTPGRRDVPLNAVLLLVFSEPIDTATLTPTSASLTRDGSPVAGALAFGDAERLTVTFTPAGPLAAGAEYTLHVTQEFADLNGDQLAAPATVEFATPAPFQLQGRIAFVSTRDGNLETDPDVDCPTGADWCITPEADPATECDLQADTHCIPPASIYSIDAAGGGLLRLTTSLGDAAPAWSPDGNQVAFAGYDEGIRSVYVMSADGSNVTRRTDGLLTRYGPEVTWSPDGSRIAFSGESALTMVDNANGTITLLPDAYTARQPSWSPDGRQLAGVFGPPNSEQFNVYTKTVDGGIRVALTQFGPADPTVVLHPAWSPDGSMIAYLHRSVVDDSFYRVQVALMSASGAFIKYLAPAGDFAPFLTQYEMLDPGPLAWSPDGRAIAYSHCDSDLPAGRPCSETRSIRFVTLDGAQQGTIVTDAHSPSWRP